VWLLLNVESLSDDAWNLHDTKSPASSVAEFQVKPNSNPKIVDSSFRMDLSSYPAGDVTAAWPSLEELKNTMIKCTNSHQIVDSQGNAFHVCCHSSKFQSKEGNASKMPCIFKGVSIMRESMDGEPEFLMGMGVCCKQPSDNEYGMKKCVVASMCSGMGDEVELKPLIMVCNTMDSDKIYAFGGKGSQFDEVAPRKYWEAPPVWHMKLYKTAVQYRDDIPHEEEGEGSEEFHKGFWHFICSIKIANITVYMVELANGSIDLVLVRSKVVPSPDHAKDMQTMQSLQSSLMQQASALMNEANTPSCADRFQSTSHDGMDFDEEDDDLDEFGDSMGSFTRGTTAAGPPSMHPPDVPKLKPVSSLFSSPAPLLFQAPAASGGSSRRLSWFRPASAVRGD